MTNLSNAGRVVADWLFQANGYNTTSTRLTDRTGLGNHLVRTGAAPTFTSHSSIEGMVMGVASTKFSAPSVVPAPFTFIAVTHALLDAADNIGLFKALPKSFGGQQAPFLANDPAWETPDATSVYEAAAKYIQVYLRGSDNTARILTRDSNSTNADAGAAYTNSAWQVIQAAIDPASLLLKIRVNKGAIATAPITSGNYVIFPNDTMFVDERSTGIVSSAGKHGTIARASIINGDPMTDNLAGLNAVVDALVIDPAAVGS